MQPLHFKQASMKALRTFQTSLPIMFGMLLLVNLITALVGDYYENVFTGNMILDPLIGALVGSVSFGMPMTSYIISGELLASGVGILAVTAFILTWTTVGVVMLPLETKFFGIRFAIARNTLNFIFAIIISVLTVSTLTLCI
jgi:hypothetical protein